MIKRSLLALTLTLASAPGWACEPAYQDTEGEIFFWDVVFDGRVASVSQHIRDQRSLLEWAQDAETTGVFGDDGTDAYGCRVGYFVSEGFRGANQPIVYVLREAFIEPVDCSDYFQVGATELVLAMKDDDGGIYQPMMGNCFLPMFGSEDELRETARRLRAEMRIW